MARVKKTPMVIPDQQSEVDASADHATRTERGATDRILNLYQEPSPLSASGPLSGTFWEQYFSLQELAMQVEHVDGRLSLTVTNQTTGEQYHFADLRLQIDDGSQRN